MQPDIKTIEPKKLIGISVKMSLADNLTGDLWRSFIPRINEIKTKISTERISLQHFNESYFTNFSPANEFTKWAAVEVSDFNAIPSSLETLTIPKGLYAVFHYIGSSTDPSIFQYIFSKWLPESIYQLDNRPHFEILGEKYKNADPTSEEDIYIPVKEK